MCASCTGVAKKGYGRDLNFIYFPSSFIWNLPSKYLVLKPIISIPSLLPSPLFSRLFLKYEIAKEIKEKLSFVAPTSLSSISEDGKSKGGSITEFELPDGKVIKYV